MDVTTSRRYNNNNKDGAVVNRGAFLGLHANEDLNAATNSN